MSFSKVIASVFVLSSILVSVHASAEESPSFVAQNTARKAAFEQVQQEMTAKTLNHEQSQEKSVDSGNVDSSVKG